MKSGKLSLLLCTLSSEQESWRTFEVMKSWSRSIPPRLIPSPTSFSFLYAAAQSSQVVISSIRDEAVEESIATHRCACELSEN